MKDVTATRGVISTGNAEIDKKIGGGIPVGSLTLIEGDSDSGKSVFSQQLIWGSLRNGYRATLFTTENTVRSLVRQMESLNLDIVDYLLLGRFRIFPIQAMKAKQNPDEVLPALARALGGQKDRDIVIVDSLTTFIVHAPTETVISFFEDSKNYCNEGMSILVVVHSYAFSDSTIIRIGSMCDAHLRLKTEAVGAQLIKIMEVAKVRGAERNTGNIISFDVEPGSGMRIIPYVKAKA